MKILLIVLLCLNANAEIGLLTEQGDQLITENGAQLVLDDGNSVNLNAFAKAKNAKLSFKNNGKEATLKINTREIKLSKVKSNLWTPTKMDISSELFDVIQIDLTIQKSLKHATVTITESGYSFTTDSNGNGQNLFIANKTESGKYVIAIQGSNAAKKLNAEVRTTNNLKIVCSGKSNLECKDIDQ